MKLIYGFTLITNSPSCFLDSDYDLDMDDVPFNKQMRNQQDQHGRDITHFQSGSHTIKTVSATLLVSLTVTMLGLVSVI